MVAGTTSQRRNKGFLMKGFIFVCLFVGFFVFLAQTSSISLPVSLPTFFESKQSASALTGTEKELTVPLSVADIKNTGFLELVNRDTPVNPNNLVGGKPVGLRLVSSFPSIGYSTHDIELQGADLEAVNKLFIDARAAGIKTLYVSSGYRTYATQKQIYNEAQNKSFVQPPNHSEHQSGLAVDIMASDVTLETMASSREGRWLADNSWKYGLILRYARDKIDITGIAYEPWHFRYVGQPHAWYCQQNNLCLEEYLDFLRREGGYRADYGGKTYTVVYVIPKDGKIYVPENKSFSVSSDNRGGYVVTIGG
ncbi:MAG: M15 family metallopeptidase [Peptococcaceae bacterium]|nr:M15 family metallopeptidase [Peptococcaceae bacterium]